MSTNLNTLRGAVAYAAIAVAALALGGARHASADLITNGGFETQGAGDATTAAGWNLSAEGGISPTSNIRDTNHPLSGSYNLHLSVTGSGTAGGPVANALSVVDFASPATVNPGTLYTLAYNTSGTFGPGTVLNVFIDWYRADGGLLARNLKEVDTVSSAGYINHSLSDTAPANAAYFDVFFNFVTGAENGDTGDLSIDNVSFNGPGGSVPEPASLGLLGAGACALLARRRR